MPRLEALTDREFVQHTIEARAANDKVWLAYALATLENVDEGWPALHRALRGITISDLCGRNHDAA
jgi:hypothetical protein